MAKRNREGSAAGAEGGVAAGTAGPDRLAALAAALDALRRDPPKGAGARSAKLLASGVPKMAQKLVEEAGEAAIEAALGRREALVQEAADLLYHLVALLLGAGVAVEDVWAEMDRREALLGLAEKLPKAGG